MSKLFHWMMGVNSLNFLIYFLLYEYGNLGNSHSGSKHFVIGTIVVDISRSLIFQKVDHKNSNTLI